MKTTDLYTKKIECCGCELCSVVCPRNLIVMRPDNEGFLYPFIKDDSNCIHCHRCTSICPAKSPGRTPNQIIDNYGGYSLELDSIKKSSSGGYATAISEAFVSKGGIVYGVRFTDDYYEVVYARATSIKELELFRTSKYSQAHKGTVYTEVLNDLKDQQKVLFIGLPCEVSALYHYVGNNYANLFTMSLICHGPTSPMVQKDFVKDIESKLKSKLISFTLRNKQEGWKPYYILAKAESGGVYKQKFNESSYGTAFLYMKRPSCSACGYKHGNKDFGLMSDITLGDFHSVSKGMPQYNKWGVSQLSVQSEKGRYLLSLISQTCKVEFIPQERIDTGNIAFQKAMPMKKGRTKFVKAYLSHSLSYAGKIPQVIIPRLKDKVQMAIIGLLVKIKHLF